MKVRYIFILTITLVFLNSCFAVTCSSEEQNISEYRRKIIFTEPDLENRNVNEPVDIYLTFDSNKAYLNSIRVKDSNQTEIPSQVWDSFTAGNHYSSAKVSFFVNISKDAQKEYYVYYTNHNIGSPSYIGVNHNGNKGINCSNGADYVIYDEENEVVGLTNAAAQDGMQLGKQSGIFTLVGISSSLNKYNITDNGPIFIRVKWDVSLSRYMTIRVFDNGVSEIKFKNTQAPYWTPSCDCGSFLNLSTEVFDYWNYYGCSSICSNPDGWNAEPNDETTTWMVHNRQLKKAKIFFEATDSKNLFFIIADDSKTEILKQSYKETGANQPPGHHIFNMGEWTGYVRSAEADTGWTGGTGYSTSFINSDKEYTIYQGWATVGSTEQAEKRNFVDKLYNIYVASKLSNYYILGSEEVISSAFCFGNASYPTSNPDENQTLCKAKDYTWMEGATGTYTPCCGDDGNNDNFSNATHQCLNSILILLAAETCGNGVCAGNETKSNCCTDCGCNLGFLCISNQCNLSTECGDKLCQTAENSSNCCTDCNCSSGYICQNNICILSKPNGQYQLYVIIGIIAVCTAVGIVVIKKKFKIKKEEVKPKPKEEFKEGEYKWA